MLEPVVNLTLNLFHSPCDALPVRNAGSFIPCCATYNEDVTSRYRVVLVPAEEGFSVSCPGLPGCWSQGITETDALENIQDAIREYLAAVGDSTRNSLVREVEVTV